MPFLLALASIFQADFFRHRVVVKLADEGLPHGGGPDQVGPGPPACDVLSERIDSTSGRPGPQQRCGLIKNASHRVYAVRVPWSCLAVEQFSCYAL